ncbi:hypothetical protein EV714DRAFT_280218 [Schizophyllum commune]
MAAAGSKFQAFMNHPAGPKTVFFWAPLMKWCLVAAGLKDLSRPADKLSVSQNVGTCYIVFYVPPRSFTSHNTQLPAFAAKRHEGMNAAVHRILPCFTLPYPAQFPVVDLPIAQCHAVRIHMKSVQCVTIPAPRRLSSLRLLRSCLSSSVSEEPEKEPMALDASPNMPPFSCK